MKYMILVMALLLAGCEKGGDSININTEGDVHVIQESSVTWDEMTEEEREAELEKIDAGVI